MKNFSMIRYAALIILSVFVMSFAASAQENATKEVKFKTTITSKQSINRLEIMTNLLKGVTESSYDNNSKTLIIKYNPNLINTDVLSMAMESLGYKAEIVESNKTEKEAENHTVKK
jgi:ABC-type proline/glycine betaine transport system substrate-binding protein